MLSRQGLTEKGTKKGDSIESPFSGCFILLLYSVFFFVELDNLLENLLLRLLLGLEEGSNVVLLGSRRDQVDLDTATTHLAVEQIGKADDLLFEDHIFILSLFKSLPYYH